MKNKETILDTIIKAHNGHYCHVIEVAYTEDISNTIESIVCEYNDNHNLKDFIDFFNTLQIIYFDEEGECPDIEEEVYNYAIKEDVINTYKHYNYTSTFYNIKTKLIS